MKTQLNKVTNYVKLQLKSPSTWIGLIVLYFLIVHNDAIHKFIEFLFFTAGQQLITNIVNNQGFINTVGTAIATYLVIKRDKK